MRGGLVPGVWALPPNENPRLGKKKPSFERSVHLWIKYIFLVGGVEPGGHPVGMPAHRETLLGKHHSIFRTSVVPADSWPGGWQGHLSSMCLTISRGSEEAGAPQTADLAQVGRQRAAHLAAGGADFLCRLHGLAQGPVQLLQVPGLKLDGVPAAPGCPTGGCAHGG